MLIKCSYRRLGIMACISVSLISIYCIILNNKICNKEIVIESNLIEIEHILDSDIPCFHERKLIFFHETSSNTSSDGTVSLTPRQACSIESAARLNPNSNIFLIFATRTELEYTSIYMSRKDKILQQLLMYKNVNVKRADLKNYTKNTPLEEWYLTGKLQESKYLISHTSDVMRYLTLWKYGGTYLDLDVIIIKNLDELGENFAAVQSNTDVAAGALNFDFRGWGHIIVDNCVKEIESDFRGDVWGHNGPGVVTKILKLYCDTESVLNMTLSACNGFKVLPASSFYPIPYQSWEIYFDPIKVEEVKSLTKESYGIHVWNKLSFDSNINKTKGDVPYTYMAKHFCPHIYETSGDDF